MASCLQSRLSDSSLSTSFSKLAQVCGRRLLILTVVFLLTIGIMTVIFGAVNSGSHFIQNAAFTFVAIGVLSVAVAFTGFFAIRYEGRDSHQRCFTLFCGGLGCLNVACTATSFLLLFWLTTLPALLAIKDDDIKSIYPKTDDTDIELIYNRISSNTDWLNAFTTIATMFSVFSLLPLIFACCILDINDLFKVSSSFSTFLTFDSFFVFSNLSVAPLLLLWYLG